MNYGGGGKVLGESLPSFGGLDLGLRCRLVGEMLKLSCLIGRRLMPQRLIGHVEP